MGDGWVGGGGWVGRRRGSGRVRGWGMGGGPENPQPCGGDDVELVRERIRLFADVLRPKTRQAS